MNASLLIGVFAASLLASLHCAGMCGGLAAFATSPIPKQPGPDGTDGNCAKGLQRARLRGLGSQLCYNGGRLGSYAALGAFAGLFGAGIDAAGNWAGFGRAATLTSAVLMVGWALSHLLPLWRPRHKRSRLSQTFSQALGKAVALPELARALIVGLGTGLLPCGLLYAFVIAAGGTGSAWGGAALMFAFWLGTVPVLLGIGALTRFAGSRLLRRIPTLSALAVLTVGLGNLYQHFNVPAEVLEQLFQEAQDAPPAPSPPPCH